MDIELSVPIWTIHHLAAALFVSEDTAHEFTYRHDFPAAKAIFGDSTVRFKAAVDELVQLRDRLVGETGDDAAAIIARGSRLRPGGTTRAPRARRA